MYHTIHTIHRYNMHLYLGWFMSTYDILLWYKTFCTWYDTYCVLSFNIDNYAKKSLESVPTFSQKRQGESWYLFSHSNSSLSLSLSFKHYSITTDHLRSISINQLLVTEKYYVHNIFHNTFTTNPNWQAVTGF